MPHPGPTDFPCPQSQTPHCRRKAHLLSSAPRRYGAITATTQLHIRDRTRSHSLACMESWLRVKRGRNQSNCISYQTRRTGRWWRTISRHVYHEKSARFRTRGYMKLRNRRHSRSRHSSSYSRSYRRNRSRSLHSDVWVEVGQQPRESLAYCPGLSGWD